MTWADRSSSATSRRSATDYGVAGIEPRLTWAWNGNAVLRGELVALVRLHYERAREQILLTGFPAASSGEIVDDEPPRHRAGNRDPEPLFAVGSAAHHARRAGRELPQSAPRKRERTTLPDGEVAAKDVDSQGARLASRDHSWAGYRRPTLPIPDAVCRRAPRLFPAAIQRCRVAQRIGNLQLDPELSWNYELGLRATQGGWLMVDAAGFFLDQNQIIPPSESGGAVSGQSFNTGRSRHAGIEWSSRFDLLGALRQPRLSLPLVVSYTYLPLAAFVGGISDGRRLPYAPAHLLNAQLRFAHAFGIAAQVGVSFVGAQLADKESTTFPSQDGLLGEIPGYITVDARLGYSHRRSGLSVYLAGKNLTAQTYISSRAPAGIQPAGYLQLFGGCEWTWPSARQ